MINPYKSISFILILIICISNSCTYKNKNNKNIVNQIPVAIISDTLKIDVKDSTFSSLKIKNIEQYFKIRYENKQFSGTYLFYDSGKIYYGKQGMADFKQNLALETNHVFQVASTSKMFTAIAILQLIQAKKLSLYTKVHHVIAGFPYKNIRIKNLLNHTSGIPNYMYFSDTFFKQKHRYLTNNDVIILLNKHKFPLDFQPNARFKYSNTNYALLASIVERVAKIKFPEYIKTYIFNPLKMDSSFVFTSKINMNSLKVKGHSGPKNQFGTFYQNGVYGDKGIYTNIFDLFKFYNSLRNYWLIDSTLMHQAFASQTDIKRLTDSYGLGFRLRKHLTGQDVIYHNGWWQGFKAYFMFERNRPRCVIILTNSIWGGFIKQNQMFDLLNGINPLIEVKETEEE